MLGLPCLLSCISLMEWVKCCIPCFEGLFPEHDNEIQELLYLACYWHSLAKLQMHTDTSLKVLDNVTVILTNRLRHFTDFICPAYATVETDGEYNARYRAAQRKAAQATRKTASATSAELPAVNIGGKRSKSFNLHTYKFHSLPDYVPIIRLVGTTDSYSTQAVRSPSLLLCCVQCLCEVMASNAGRI